MTLPSTTLAPADRPPQPVRDRRLRRLAGFSLVETMVAIAIIGIALLGVIAGITSLRTENLATSQRMLATSLGTELLELIKALSSQNIRNSTAAAPVYLKTSAAGTPNATWRVPQAGESLALPVEEVNSASAGDPTLVADKLPQATWTASFAPDATNATLIYVTININWRLNQTSRGRALQYTLNTAVASNFPRL